MPQGFVTARSATEHATAKEVGVKEQAAIDSNGAEPPDAENAVLCDDPPKAGGTLRLANPATRGRKAATKNDAVGRPPQVLVPYEPVAILPARTQRAARPPPLTKTNTEAAATSSTSKPTQNGGSGFVRANGGAWSHHATDLLGMQRPKGRQGA